ncbi:MAG: four helix bundle protein [Verrucomicrobia bacterium]|nr:four helix bundle protein [Verrucomicrobiota bacterium]
MKNTKSQTPNPKQASNTNPKPASLVEGWHYSSSVSNKSEPWLLKDEPLKAPSAEPTVRHPFDLEERTALFGEGIVRFVKKIPRGPVNDRLIDQLVGAGTSVGGNFCEANDSESKKDFRHILKRCLKEAKESRHFLRMVATAEPTLAPEARVLYREATESLKIFSAMHRK